MENKNFLSASGFACTIQRIIYADSIFLIWLRRLFLIYICAAGLINISFSVQSLLIPYVYKKDFIQEYLLAKATLAGVSAYLPLPDLAQRFIGHIANPIFPHPTPHPPPVAVIAWPLGFLDYQTAAIVWFLFEIICIALSLSIILQWFRVKKRFRILCISLCAVFAWNPFWEELVFGQLMSLLLLLLLLSWHYLRANCPIRGGFFLGLIISVKFVGWPIVLLMALKKRHLSAAMSIATIAAINAASMLVLGYEAVYYYYTKVVGDVSTLYRSHVSNFSLWGFGWRLFDGTGSQVIAGATAPPILVSPTLARAIALILPLSLLIVGLILARRMHDFDAAFSIMICVSILINPIAWVHYMILLLLPLLVVGRRLIENYFPRIENYVVVITGLFLLVSDRRWHELAVKLGGQVGIDNHAFVNPWILSILTMIPAFLILALIWLLNRLASISKRMEISNTI